MTGLIFALLLQSAAPAAACTAAAPPPGELAGWATMTPATAGANPAAAPDIAIGKGIRAVLPVTSGITYAVTPEKPADPASHGGILALTVEHAARYRIALGAGAWVDVVHDGAAARSVAHSHGPACTGIRKMVDFDLAPGRYLIQIAGSGAATLPLIVAELPGGAAAP